MVAGERRRPAQSSSAVGCTAVLLWTGGLDHHRPAQKQASRALRSRRSARLLLDQSGSENRSAGAVLMTIRSRLSRIAARPRLDGPQACCWLAGLVRRGEGAASREDG